MSAFDDLLRVQEHDTTLDQLRHRRITLPERAELTQLEERVAGLERRLSEVGGQRDAAARRQKRLEDELASVEGKLAEIEKRLYSGSVTVPRELQAMQADVESLRRRRSDLEDEVLEAMGEREPLDDEVSRLEAERGRLDADGGRLRAAIAEAETQLDAEMEKEREARDAVATGLPAELSRVYEQLRTKLGGVGAARLVNGRCSGCHLALSATERDRIRREPPDTVIQCEQCGRLLVRSGQ